MLVMLASSGGLQRRLEGSWSSNIHSLNAGSVVYSDQPVQH